MAIEYFLSVWDALEVIHSKLKSKKSGPGMVRKTIVIQQTISIIVCKPSLRLRSFLATELLYNLWNNQINLFFFFCANTSEGTKSIEGGV